MQQTSSDQSSLFPRVHWAIAIGVSSAIIMAAGTMYYTQSQSTSTSPSLVETATQPTKVNALGRLEPQGEVIQVSEPSGQGGAYRIDELWAKVGDRVNAGQIIAILDSRDRLQSELGEAQEQVKVAQARLNQVKAGAQQGEIAAQQATIARLEAQLNGEMETQRATIARFEAELQNADVEYQRHRDLHQNGAISASVLDSKSLVLKTAQQRVNEARAALDRTIQTLQQQIQESKATLGQIAEVRPTDIAAAQAEVNRAIAATARAQAQLNHAFIRAPKAGRILRIHTHIGEAVSPEGIVELGNTEQMYAVAEVYEGDIGKVRVGQAAIVTADSIKEPLHGTVEQLGWTIAKQDVLNSDPTATTDARIVEVKIRLDKASSGRVAQLTNLQVAVEIRQ
ncbi:ABC exporter membrane fusion protein [Leptolyngbya sp. GB1-A1]|uniref:ABC exporter membrane fusion protein n=1 Tax=Leptolyngbya sp. GB1-A1 TaxID=2933908 RepID=UPI003296BA65